MAPHAVEVPRPGRSLELEAEAVLGHAVAVSVAVDLLRARQEHEVASRAAEQLEVALERARVAREVGRVVELRGIHEDARPGAGVLRLRAPDEGKVSLVQRAQRRHEARRAHAGGAAVLEELRYAGDDLHAS